MPKKLYRPEDIIAKLREVDILISQGKKVAETIKQLGVSDVTYYRWRKEYSGMTTTQVKRLKELEKENLRLRRAVSDLTLDSHSCTKIVGQAYGNCRHSSLQTLGTNQFGRP